MDLVDIANIISLFGTFCGLFSRIPQVYKIYKSKSANDISSKSLTINITANSCFLFNTIVNKNYSISINCLTVIILETTIIYMKNKYKHIKKSSSGLSLVDMVSDDNDI
tara:strand:- start:467 stop:793 length:327 start_codon:yes stop_codon:yes gene_type:complete